MQCTEQVTKGIQQLWSCIQGPQREDCVNCADRIKLAVSHLTAAVTLVRFTLIFSCFNKIF